MPRKEKINIFQEIVGIKNNAALAEKYLIRANWDVDKAIDIYYKEIKIIPKNKTLPVNQNAQVKFDFKISDKLYSSDEVYTNAGKSAYIDMIRFFEEKVKVSLNFGDFLNLLKTKAGLLIIFPKEKLYEVRNNMVRAINNSLTKDILKNAVIFPVMTKTEVGDELVKQLSLKAYPVFLFCKYKNLQIMTINDKVEKKFRMDNVINNLLDCYPENEVKQSIYQSINNTLINYKRKKPEKDDDDFSGDENEIDNNIKKLQNDIKLSMTLFMQKNENNFFKPSIIDNKDEQINNDKGIKINNNNEDKINNNNEEKVENNVKEEKNNNNNNKHNNRFQNLFSSENSNSSLLINNGPNINDLNPLIEESNINIKPNDKKEEDEEEEFVTIIIPKEPDINDPDACKITFRYPYDEKYIERRFNKNDKIKVLYDYVNSLGKEIYSKPIYHSFELIYGFPPINFENIKDKTLESEGLFPSSTINITEK